GISREEYLTTKFGSPERYRAIAERVARAAAAEGLTYNLDNIKRQPNTLDGHRLILWAGESAARMKQRLMELYFAEGGDRTDRDVLVTGAAECDLDGEWVRQRLAGEDDVERVTRDAESAKEAGIERRALFYLRRACRRAGRAGARTSRAGDRPRRRWTSATASGRLASLESGIPWAGLAADSSASATPAFRRHKPVLACEEKAPASAGRRGACLRRMKQTFAPAQAVARSLLLC